MLIKSQLEIAKDKSRFKVVVTGRRWGKSVLGREMILKKAKEKPKSLNWIVAPTREMNKDIHWNALKERCKNLNWKIRINETNLSITRLVNSSQIILKTADNPDRLRGRGLDFVVLDEFRDMEKNIWQEILRPALSDKQGEALFISTPNGLDELHDLYLNGEQKIDGWKSWLYKTIDSPFVSFEEIENARRELDKVTFEQEYEASFNTGHSLPYYSYTQLNNCDYQLDKNLPVIITCDFNATQKPMSWVIGQRLIAASSDITHWTHSVSLKNTNTLTMCSVIDEDYFKKKYPVKIIFYGDYAGTHHKSNSSFSDWEIIENFFRNKTQIEKRLKPCLSIRDSIASTNAQLMTASNQQRQYINPSGCRSLINDFQKCQWKENGKELKDNVPELGHACRAVDYYNYYEHNIREIGRASCRERV